MYVIIVYSNHIMQWMCSDVYFSIPRISINAAFFLITMHWPVCHWSAWQRISKWNESTDSCHPLRVPRSSIFIRL